MDFSTTMSRAGINPADVDIDRIGAWQQLRTDDKPGRKNGRVMVFSNRPLRLYYQNHSAGIAGHYSDGPSFLSRQDFAQVRRAKADAAVCRELNQVEIAKMAGTNWQIAKPADPQHAYLVRKQVRPHGIRQLGDNLVVPMLDAAGKLWSYQTITGAGEKKYLYGGRKRGCFYQLGDVPRSVIVLAEGFATAATLHDALNIPVACCFDAINLEPVAVAVRQQYPNVRIVIGADNDRFTEGNPGLTYATKAAGAVHGLVTYPEFGLPGIKDKLTDWNDLAVCYNATIIAQLFAEVLA